MNERLLGMSKREALAGSLEGSNNEMITTRSLTFGSIKMYNSNGSIQISDLSSRKIGGVLSVLLSYLSILT